MNPESAYRAFYPPLVSWVLSKCKSREQAEDIAGETFSRLLSGPEMNGATKHWLCVVAHNLWIEIFRREPPMASLDEPETEWVTLKEPGDFTRDLEWRMEWDSVVKAVEQLTPAQHQTLSRRLAGRSCQGTQGSRLFKARYDLAKLCR